MGDARADDEDYKELVKAADNVISEIVRGLRPQDFFKSFTIGGTAFDAYWYTYPPVIRGLVALRELPDGVIEVVTFGKNEADLVKKLQTERQ